MSGRWGRAGVEALVRAILAHPPTATHSAIGAELGVGREVVRRIRLGQRWSDVAPEIERLEPDQIGRECRWCVHWEPRAGNDGRGRCGLGIPEPRTEGLTWARGCGAYTRAE